MTVINSGDMKKGLELPSFSSMSSQKQMKIVSTDISKTVMKQCAMRNEKIATKPTGIPIYSTSGDF
jgi:hypothetical protein